MSYVSRLSKILWGEGLFLRPQHFQRQDAYHEARLQEVSRTLHPYAWGVRRVRLDVQALTGGTLRVLELSVSFPDGESYDAPTHDILPTAISLRELPEGMQSTLIHVALPLLREDAGGNLMKPGGGSPARYVQADHETSDLFTGAAEANLAFLDKNVRLLIDDQPRDAYSTIAIARIRRTSSGGFELDEAFMAPSSTIQASMVLQGALRSMLDALQAKADALQGLHRQTSQNIVEFRSGDVASFWLLHTINSAFSALAHLHHHPQLHPERLYQELLRVCGALMTFSSVHQLSDLPAYRHDEPEGPFKRTITILRTLLDTVISTRYFQIALQEVKPSYHLGHLDSQRIDEHAAFYLAVSASIPAQDLIQNVPIQFKAGAPDDVETCVLSALPGVRLDHAAQVPAAIPVRPGSHYFALESRGPLYERMIKSKSMMIYVPAGIADLKMELIAVAA